jgi:hypothetical protein
MSHRTIRLLAFCLPVILALAGCASKDQPSIPVTGKKSTSIPAQVELAHENVLEYVISSSRIADIPSSENWQLNNDKQTEGEYRFSSNNWLMIVWSADAQEENQKVVIQNQAKHAFWCGYVRPDGRVVDTSYTR